MNSGFGGNGMRLTYLSELSAGLLAQCLLRCCQEAVELELMRVGYCKYLSNRVDEHLGRGEGGEDKDSRPRGLRAEESATRDHSRLIQKESHREGLV